MKLANFTDPQKPPKSTEISATVSHFGPQNPVEILLSNQYRSQTGSKNSRRGTENIFYIYLSHFYDFWDVQKFLRFWRSFWKFGLVGQIFFKNRPSSKMSKNIIFQHLLFFCCFLGQSGVSCLHLPNFTSQKFLRA